MKSTSPSPSLGGRRVVQLLPFPRGVRWDAFISEIFLIDNRTELISRGIQWKDGR
jgi:hypothetical protein